jgi:hypothetical protein
VSGLRPDPTSAEVGIPRTSKKFLFLILFLLAKGEKVQPTSLDRKMAVAFLLFQDKCDSPFGFKAQPLFPV